MIKYLLPLMLIVSCKADKKYIQDDLVNQYFSNSEIEELGNILKFYDDHVLSLCNQTNKTLPNCYRELGAEILKKLNETGIVCYPIEFNQPDSTLIKSQLENLGISKEIWDTTTWIIRDTFPRNELTYRSDGKYFEFIEATSKQDSLIDRLFSHFHDSGGILTPAMLGEFLNLNQFEPFSDRQRLIIAIPI
jgi:hypothetical protein